MLLRHHTVLLPPIGCQNHRPSNMRTRATLLHNNELNSIGPHITDDFLTNAEALREHFDMRFAGLRTQRTAVAHCFHRFSNPRDFDGRFVWDYWHVPGQYTLVRTPAESFFPTDLYQELERQLLHHAMSLGCRALTPVWLSYYVEGCRQELHTDSPHGPWCVVVALT